MTNLQAVKTSTGGAPEPPRGRGRIEASTPSAVPDVRLALPVARWGASRILATVILAVTFAAVLYGLVLNIAASAVPESPSEGDDSILYQRVIDRMQAGEPYYQVVVDEHRRLGYPLRPFVTVRLPSLAVALSTLPGDVTRKGAIGLLAVLTMLAWTWRIWQLQLGLARFTAAVLLINLGIGPAFVHTIFLFHEAWAGLLIALSIALHGPRLWWLSLMAGIAAALIRELAGAYLLAMLALALWNRRWIEAVGWAAGLAVWAGMLVAHAGAVHALVQPTDLASPGWAEFNGLSFVLGVASWNLVSKAGPWFVPILLPLSLLGLVMLRSQLGERVALTVVGYIVAFLAIGRPENSYWGLLIAPLWPVGVVFAPMAVMMLVRQALGRPAPAHPASTPVPSDDMRSSDARAST